MQWTTYVLLFIWSLANLPWDSCRKETICLQEGYCYSNIMKLKHISIRRLVQYNVKLKLITTCSTYIFCRVSSDTTIQAFE